MIKAFWNPLTVTSDWKTMTADILLDEKAVGAPGLASIQLSIICYGEGACYIDDISALVTGPSLGTPSATGTEVPAKN